MPNPRTWTSRCWTASRSGGSAPACTRRTRGETHILAVDPAHRRHDIGRALNEHPYRRLREAGLRMAMVETGSDRGHAPARATYEAEGFVRWPVARYFKDLAPQGTDDAEA